MLKTLFLNFKINSYYTINTYIYSMKKLPIIGDLLEEDSYRHKSIKWIGFIFGLIMSVVTFYLLKAAYFGYMYLVSKFIPGDTTNHFVFIYFIMSILGMLINSRSILFVNANKYFSLFLFDMNPLNYTKSIVVKGIIENFIFNILLFITYNYFLHLNTLTIILLLISNIFFRVVGEAFNLYFINKKGYSFYSGTKRYFTTILIFVLISLLCYFFSINNNILIFIDVILLILSIISWRYICNYKDYKLFYKRLVTYDRVMGINTDEVLKDSLYEINKKDKEINSKKLIGKTGFDKFNIIFFERHRNILYRSLNIVTGVIIVLYLILIGYCLYNPSFVSKYSDFYIKFIGIFPFIMYMINRSNVMTQVMFHNSDNALFEYNFFNEKKVVFGLYIRRLLTIIKANLLPAVIIGIGNTILMYIIGYNSIMIYIGYFIYVLCLSVLFSTHYLSLYYLIQPYNKDMKITSPLYSFLLLVVYIITINLIMIKSYILIPITIIFSVIYVLLCILLVYIFGYKTFKMKR